MAVVATFLATTLWRDADLYNVSHREAEPDRCRFSNVLDRTRMSVSRHSVSHLLDCKPAQLTLTLLRQT